MILPKKREMHHSEHLGCPQPTGMGMAQPPKIRAMHGLQWDRWPTIAWLQVQGLQWWDFHRFSTSKRHENYGKTMEWWMICMINATIFHETITDSSRIPWKSAAAPHLSSRQISRMKDQVAMESATILDSATLSGAATWAGQQKSLGIPWRISGSSESKKWESLGFPELQAAFLIGSFLKYFAMGPNVSATAYPSSEKQSVDRPHLAHFATFPVHQWHGTRPVVPVRKLGHPGDILYILIQTLYPLVMTNSLLLNMAIEIVSFPH